MTGLFMRLIFQSIITSLLFSTKKKKRPPVFFPPEPHLNNGGLLFSLSDAGVPPEVNLSAWGRKEERENRKVRTPCSRKARLQLCN